ncbi:hypothetical protein L2Y96_03305 [Luteibacter aegosomaticola]|uniref:hypothetical protein n=1 Tax=Luteibacter aegosomaticola TaxID=2911538 RepID=UPI001FF866C8|nr:hypothetical protein [Luteibacter aegosomaticola]UPG90817.1 hypothetical protein L2Y96_03305 [Luteibacter aegosomaticola]
MDGLTHTLRSQCWRRCGARLATLLCLGIAALASCQPFRDDDAVFYAPLTDFADYDACVDRGGSWLTQAHRCKEPPAGDAGVPAPP